MSVTKVPSAGIDQTTNFAFTGTVTGASDLVLIDTKTISSGSANIDFTSGIGSTYDLYQFHIINIDVSRAVKDLYLYCYCCYICIM